MKKLTKQSVRMFQKIEAIYKQIQSVDKEIESINELATLVVAKKTTISFSLSVKDEDAEHKEKTKLQFDEDGSIIVSNEDDSCQNFFGWARKYHPVIMSMDSLGALSRKENKSKNTKQLKENLSESTCLQILGVLLQEKYKERNNLISQLEQKGFTL